MEQIDLRRMRCREPENVFERIGVECYSLCVVYALELHQYLVSAAHPISTPPQCVLSQFSLGSQLGKDRALRVAGYKTNTAT